MKTLKIHVFFIILSVFGHQLYAQDIILPLQRVSGSEPNLYVYQTDIAEKPPTLVGIPDSMKNYKILYLDFHYQQSVF